MPGWGLVSIGLHMRYNAWAKEKGWPAGALSEFEGAEYEHVKRINELEEKKQERIAGILHRHFQGQLADWQILSYAKRTVQVSNLRREAQNYLRETKIKAERVKMRLRQQYGLPIPPIVVVKFSGKATCWVLDGHHRSVVAEEFGIFSIPAYVIELENPNKVDVEDNPRLERAMKPLVRMFEMYTDVRSRVSPDAQSSGINLPASNIKSYPDLKPYEMEGPYIINNLHWKNKEILAIFLESIPHLTHAELEDPTPNPFPYQGEGGRGGGLSDPRLYSTYLASRPRRWENNALELMARLAGETGAHLHVVHLSSTDRLDLIHETRA
jgi:hypothetical protein